MTLGRHFLRARLLHATHAGCSRVLVLRACLWTRLKTKLAPAPGRLRLLVASSSSRFLTMEWRSQRASPAATPCPTQSSSCFEVRKTPFKKPLFLQMLKTDHFTKTGSGQTQDKMMEKAVPAGGPWVSDDGGVGFASIFRETGFRGAELRCPGVSVEYSTSNFPNVIVDPDDTEHLWLAGWGPSGQGLHELLPKSNRSWVCEDGIFEPFIYRCDLFTKTGSGQT